ncbi:helix-turn-helix transcriptional regulator [Marinobacterium lutimaris]|uniref:Transcriptional regulator, LuxR family n=1 Tax=Marinobacterium lutimaris TaxID=568106 RepID=A0A1H6D7K6_9GAMM|nr:helix-turn-helix transcriptional regulator [Marinobacterium lutimaris]SEG81048.1 transcriptional regulator, LuxR family [Marinobacterium lutimaris]
MLNENKFIFCVRIFFVVIIVASVSDIVFDIRQGAHPLHVFQELLMGIFALLFLLTLFMNTRLQTKCNAELKKELVKVKAESAKASQQLVAARRTFGEAVVKQFSDWSFTDSETEVALFTLKGLTAKEIANLRNASEKTVRNQLTSIYKKSGTAGKLGFIAWFMEGLM